MEEDNKISIEQLKRLEPLSALSDERLQELHDLADVERIGVGVTVFREGDVDNQSVFLLKGDVQLSSISNPSIEKVISHKSAEAKHPLAEGQPRQMSCVAMTLVEILRIDNSVLDYMMTWDQLAVAEQVAEEPAAEADAKQEVATQVDAVTESDKDDGQNWIRRMRHIMAFKSMPPANIKTLLQRMETVSVAPGDKIIQQGEPGDYYYVLTEGEALVTRTVELATLGAGSSFGEEALLSGSKRNASVTMKTPGQLMRLAKKDFDELLKEPLLDRVPADEARVRVAKGALWLDVRHAMEYHHSRLPKALNIPLHELRMRMKELDKSKQYICYCGTGRRSSAAAFLLVQNGFKAAVLNGGVQSIPQDLKRS